MEATHIWNLEEIQLKMTELEWPQQQTDRWREIWLGHKTQDSLTDGQTDAIQ